MTEQQPRELPADCGIVRILDGDTGKETFAVVDAAGRVYWDGTDREALSFWLAAQGERALYKAGLKDWKAADKEAAAVMRGRRRRSRSPRRWPKPR